MTSNPRFDVAVLGQGIVGASLALFLDRKGLRVVSIEPRRLLADDKVTIDDWTPRRRGVVQQDQPHTLLAPAVRAIAAHLPDVLSTIIRDGARLRDDLTGELVEASADVKFPKIEARRLVLTRALERAVLESGVTLVQAAARDIEIEPSHATVVTAGPAWQAGLVIDCRGLRSRPLAGERKGQVIRSPSSLEYHTQWIKGSQDAKPLWSQLDADRYSVLTFAADNDYMAATIAVSRQSPLRGWTRTPDRFRAVLRLLGGCERMAECRAVGSIISSAAGGNYWRSAVGPYGPVQPRLLRCGDALLRTNPTFGRGISTGLMTAERISGTIEDALTAPMKHAVVLHAWEDATLRPWFDSQCRLDRQRERTIAGLTTERLGDPDLYAELAMRRHEDADARRLLTEVKHLSRTWAEVANSPSAAIIAKRHRMSVDPPVENISLPSESLLINTLLREPV